MNPSPAGARIGTIAVALATALVLISLAILPFLTPAWVGFEQGRTGAAALTEYAPEQLQTATNGILADLVLGPPDFDVKVPILTMSAGVRDVFVLTESERAHMRDVRSVFAGFFAAAAVAAVILGAAFWLAARRDASSWTRRQAWLGVRLGAIGLGAGVVVAGVIALVAFDAAFAVFHRLFFAAGNYLFDPATSKLVQLFPFAFWMESTMAVGGVTLVLAVATAWFAGRRLQRAAASTSAPGTSTDAGRDHVATLTPADPGAAR